MAEVNRFCDAAARKPRRGTVSGLLYPNNILGLTFDVVRSYSWNTGFQKALTNKQSALAYLIYPPCHFELNYELLRDDITTSDIKALVGIHNAVMGRGDTFLYTDPEFNSVTAQAIATSTGSTATRYQLIATYQNSGGPGTPEAIQNLNGTPTLFDNGSSILGSHYTIDATGGITFSTSPTTGHAITWTGAFYYRCRFDDDKIDWTKFLNKWWKASRIGFESILL